MNITLQDLLKTEKAIPHFLERTRSTNTVLSPISTELHWTSACNYDCSHCSYGSRRKDKGFLTPKITEDLLDDLISLKIKSLYLSGGGEPTVFRDWNKYASKALENKIDVALITNGILVDDQKLDLIRRMNYIAISIYSTDEQEYKQITGANNFDKQFSLAKKIKEFAYRCIVGSRCVINNTNYNNIINIYQKAIEEGFDYVIFIPAVDYENNNIALDAEKLVVVKSLINENLQLINEKNTNLLSVAKKDVNHYSPVDYRKTMNDYHECSMLEIRSNAFVNYDGGIYLCQPHIGNQDFCIGNLNEKRFIQIWNSDQHIKVLSKLNNEFREGKCKYCRAIGFNQAIDNFIDKHQTNYDCFV